MYVTELIWLLYVLLVLVMAGFMFWFASRVRAKED
jgi:flagellar basal body-associated protein FliL